MFDNKKVNGVHYTRIIASFCKFSKNPFIFEDWLKSLRIDDFGVPNSKGRKLTKDEIHDLIDMFECGKLELETDAQAFVEKLKNCIQTLINTLNSVTKLKKSGKAQSNLPFLFFRVIIVPLYRKNLRRNLL